MSDNNQAYATLFEEDKDFTKGKPNPRKEYRRKPKNVNQLEEWIDDEVDEDILKHIRHI